MLLPPAVILCNVEKGASIMEALLYDIGIWNLYILPDRPGKADNYGAKSHTQIHKVQVLGNCSHGPISFNNVRNSCLVIIEGGIKRGLKWNCIYIHTSVT